MKIAKNAAGTNQAQQIEFLACGGGTPNTMAAWVWPLEPNPPGSTEQNHHLMRFL